MSRGEKLKVSFGEFDKLTKFVFSEKFPNRCGTDTGRQNYQNQVRFVTRTGCVIVRMFDFFTKISKKHSSNLHRSLGFDGCENIFETGVIVNVLAIHKYHAIIASDDAC